VKRRVYVGPAEELTINVPGVGPVRFERGVAVEVPDEFAEECDRRSHESGDVKVAAIYGGEVWADPDASASDAGEEDV